MLRPVLASGVECKVRALVLGVPSGDGGAEREHPLLGAAFFIVAAGRRRNAASNHIFIESLAAAPGQNQIGKAAHATGFTTARTLLAWCTREVQADAVCGGIPKFQTFAENPSLVAYAAVETAVRRGEGLSRASATYRAVIADELQHHRLLASATHPRENMDAFGLQPLFSCSLSYYPRCLAACR